MAQTGRFPSVESPDPVIPHPPGNDEPSTPAELYVGRESMMTKLFAVTELVLWTVTE
jgi:hypothetical protein